MRYCSFLILCFLFSKGYSQDITGLWSGTLYNDTTHQTYQYEVAISEEHGKLYGYSHTWFIMEDKRFYGVKKVKVTRKDGRVIMEDNGLIANNYPVAPAKHVRQLNVLTLEIKDSIMVLSGPFSTNATKEYRPLTGNIILMRKNDYWKSDLVPHLKELGMEQNLSFVQQTIIKKTEASNDYSVVEKTHIKSKEKKPEKETKAPDLKKYQPLTSKKNIPAINIPPASEVNMRKTVVQETVFFKADRDRKSTRLNSSHHRLSRMPSSA